MSLEGRTIAILIAPEGTEEVEFVKPKEAIESAGGKVVVVGIEKGQAKTVNGDLEPGGKYDVDVEIGSVDPQEYDGIVIPGGTVGSDKLRSDENVVSFVKKALSGGKSVAVICHGPWVLVEAGAVKGRRVASFPSLKTDINNAGGTWTDEEVVVDGQVITSRNPDDLPAFCSKLVEVFGE